MAAKTNAHNSRRSIEPALGRTGQLAEAAKFSNKRAFRCVMTRFIHINLEDLTTNFENRLVSLVWDNTSQPLCSHCVHIFVVVGFALLERVMDIAELENIPEPHEEDAGGNNTARRRLRPLGMGETYDRLRSMGDEVRRNQDLVDQVLGNRRTLYDQLNDLAGLRASTRELMGRAQYDPGIRVAGAALDAFESPAMKIARGELNSPSLEAAMAGLSEAARPEPIKITSPPVIHNPIHDTNDLLAEQHETLAKMQVAIGQLAEHAAEERIDRKAEQEVARERHKATLRATKLGAYAAVGAFVLSAAAVVIALTSSGPTEVGLSPQAVAQINGAVSDATVTPHTREPPAPPAGELSARSDELRPPW